MSQKDKDLDRYLAGQSPLSRVYQAGRREEPPELLDARIRREARDTLKQSSGRRSWRIPRWLPLAAAAVVVMSVGLMVFRFERAEPPLPANEEVAAAPAKEQADRLASLPRRTAPDPAPAPFPAKRKDPGINAFRSDVPASTPPAAPKATISALPGEKKEQTMPATVSPPAAEKARMAPMSRSEMPAGAAADTGELRVAEEAAPARPAPSARADVIGVSVSGTPGAYRFSVSLSSPDTGCAQYANWWEVVSADGRLLYRRVLLHSHVGEQPFTREGGPVPVSPNTVVWVRAHMHPGGYGGTAYRGSVREGFRAAVAPAGFATGLAQQPPLPTGCNF